MLKPAVQEACREAAEQLARGDARTGPGIVVGAPWVDDDRPPQQRAAPGGRQDRRHPPQGRAAELRRLRRAARLQAGAAARAGRLPRRAPRPADLRGHLAPGGHRVPGGDRRRDPDRAERLALLERQGGRADADRGRPRRRDRPAADLRQPGGRAGRAGLRRRLVRPERRPHARLPDAAVRDRRRADALGARRGRLALRRRADARTCRRASPPTGRPACSACATTSTRTASRASCSAFPAASIRRSARRWRSMRSARSGCAASCCPTATRRRRA